MKLIYSFIIFIALALSNASTFAAGAQYAVIVDAGSTSSRAHVFEYIQSLPMFPIPVIKDIFSQSSKPPLASFSSNPSAYCANGSYFNDLLYNTYQLKNSQLSVVAQVSGTSLDWTLGALLYSLVQ